MMQNRRNDAYYFNKNLPPKGKASMPGRRRHNHSRGNIAHLHSIYNAPPGGHTTRNRSTLKGLKAIQTILLVEGEQVLRELITEVLTSNGYNVITAKDGEQAARVFSHFHSDIALVLADIHLPKLGGDRMLRIMKKIDPHVPVVFESGYSDTQLKSHLLRAGARGFIQKPEVPGEIIATIKDVLLDRR